MNWIEALLEVYEKNLPEVGKMRYKIRYTKKGMERIPYVLLPPFHTTVTAQITVVLDEDGNFLRAKTVEAEDKLTIIPVTEKSGSRTAGKDPHPLCDNLKYLAGDYVRYCQPGVKDAEVYYSLYIQALEKWHQSPYTHKKVDVIYTYLRKGTLIQDLVACKVLQLDENGILADNVKIQNLAQAVAFVRFEVREMAVYINEDYAPECWLDRTLQEAYIQYYRTLGDQKDLCYLTGERERITYLHSKKIRNEGDGAKLISANDESNFTYRGRFVNKEQAFAIGSESSQKVHNALKWIIRRQGKTYDTLSIVAWESDFHMVPSWDKDTDAVCDEYEDEDEEQWEEDEDVTVEEMQTFWSGGVIGAERFYRAMEGYGSQLDGFSQMRLMAFDAATTGRLAMMSYKTLESSRYLENIKKWHEQCQWVHLKYKKSFGWVEYIGMVGIKDIANLLFGIESQGVMKILDKNGKKIYADIGMRMIPCIWDNAPIPEDLVERAVQKASNPLIYKNRKNWERVLTLACSMVKKQRNERYKEVWKVALDRKETRRDYLYGRLLAVADRIEYRTFDKEKDVFRLTNAKRYMNRFSQRPFETWKIIEESLVPYLSKLKPGERSLYEEEMEEICNLFSTDDFINNHHLDGLYLLGFHSEAYDLKQDKGDKGGEEK